MRGITRSPVGTSGSIPRFIGRTVPECPVGVGNVHGVWLYFRGLGPGCGPSDARGAMLGLWRPWRASWFRVEPSTSLSCTAPSAPRTLWACQPGRSGVSPLPRLRAGDAFSTEGPDPLGPAWGAGGAVR